MCLCMNACSSSLDMTRMTTQAGSVALRGLEAAHQKGTLPAKGEAPSVPQRTVHGDVRLNNILAHRNLDGCVDGIKFVDFDWAGVE